MSELVTVVVSAGGASERMLKTCLCSLERHRGETSFKIWVVAPYHQGNVAQHVAADMNVFFKAVQVPEETLSGSSLHAAVLDGVVPQIDTPYMLTLDADCFPVADDWLDWMMAQVGGGAKVCGILHPFVPPGLEMEEHTVEYRIRSQLCSDNTHVACQLVGMDTLKKLGVGFADGDDTGLAIPVQARKMGMKVVGLRLTCCAYASEIGVQFDADLEMALEWNRKSCLFFGDKVYHHGGGCRELQGKGSPSDIWRHVRNGVLDKGGAEWLLEADEVYRYKFNNEEAIADEMARDIMQGMQIYLQTHDRVFEE